MANTPIDWPSAKCALSMPPNIGLSAATPLAVPCRRVMFVSPGRLPCQVRPRSWRAPARRLAIILAVRPGCQHYLPTAAYHYSIAGLQ